MWPLGLTSAMTLTLNFQGQIWNWLYLSQKWSDCHETKSKHIDWTLGLKCDHQIWPWPWPWPWIFKVKYEICYISTKSGPIATRRKANISIWTQGLKSDNGRVGFFPSKTCFFRTKWKKLDKTCFVQFLPSKTDQNWTKWWTIWSKWPLHSISESHFNRTRAKHEIANAPKISHCLNNGIS